LTEKNPIFIAMKDSKNPRFFYDCNTFEFLSPLRDSIELIIKELEALRSVNVPTSWLETFPSYVQSEHPKAWDVFTFKFFGMNHLQNQALCPITSNLIHSIPELISCDFSRMKPHTTITPHKGYSRMILRGHLPLIVPKGTDCAIRVGTEIKYHQTGKMLIFDDSYEHSAWNHSTEDRIVLMFDIANPLWGYTPDEICKYKIEHIEDPFLLSIANKTEWAEAYEKGCLPLRL
jgi:ornithine lipid ester-linked acyl 2-hydroxylase